MQKSLSLVQAGVVGTAFSAWFLASVVGQDPMRTYDRIVRRYDRYSVLIPDWRFFAPAPGIHDYHLLVQQESPDGAVTPWREVGAIEPRRPRHILWHNHRREEKALFDIVSEISRFIDDGYTENQIVLSVPYLTALRYVEARIPRGSRRVRFMLVASPGHNRRESPQVLFTSRWHPVSAMTADTPMRRELDHAA